MKSLLSRILGSPSTKGNADAPLQTPKQDPWIDFDPDLQAYDLVLSPGASENAPDYAGWCFGLPRGITPEQWPLDPESGYPLQHGFTLKLPTKFRKAGQETSAISFFSVAPDHNDGVPISTPGLSEIILNPATTAPKNDELVPFWKQAKSAHPRLHRMTDELFCHYAVIPLTDEDLTQPACEVPKISNNPYLSAKRPDWLEAGSASAMIFGPNPHENGKSIRPSWRLSAIGGLPEKRIDYSVPILLRPRLGDPNAGITPDEFGDSTYESPFDQEGRKPWAENLGECHLGGTAFPWQAMPEISECYIEFEEYFGNYNFGGGNAQLDLRTFAFDWACG